MGAGGGVLGASQASGIVVEKIIIKATGQNSGNRQCVKVNLLKNNKSVIAHVPGDGSINLIDENDTVVLENCKRKDLPNVKCKVIKVAGVTLSELLSNNSRRTRG